MLFLRQPTGTTTTKTTSWDCRRNLKSLRNGGPPRQENKSSLSCQNLIPTFLVIVQHSFCARIWHSAKASISIYRHVLWQEEPLRNQNVWFLHQNVVGFCKVLFVCILNISDGISTNICFWQNTESFWVQRYHPGAYRNPRASRQNKWIGGRQTNENQVINLFLKTFIIMNDLWS